MSEFTFYDVSRYFYNFSECLLGQKLQDKKRVNFYVCGKAGSKDTFTKRQGLDAGKISGPLDFGQSQRLFLSYARD